MDTEQKTSPDPQTRNWEHSASPHHQTADTEHADLIYAGVFLVSMAALMLQIALTRVFSFTIWYHFAYMAISVALLGYGASGSLLASFPRLAGSDPLRRLSLYALICGFSIVIAFAVVGTVPFHPFRLHKEPVRQVLYMLLYFGAVVAPFFFAGVCISLGLKMRSHHVGRFYFFDLLGAGIGCLAVTLVIWKLSVPGTVLFTAVTVGTAAIVFASAGGTRAAARAAAATAVLAGLGMAALSVIDCTPNPDKFTPSLLGQPARYVRDASRWTPIFRTDAFRFRNEEASRRFGYAFLGISPKWKKQRMGNEPKTRIAFHDGTAATLFYNFNGNIDELGMFDYHLLKVPYLLPNRREVLVIGAGGGPDVLNAIKNRARRITGVELDPVTVDIAKHMYADFVGHIYERPDVKIIVGEGRSFLRRSNMRYDVIQMSGVDTLAALSTGAFVLSESYLYTKEAISEYIEHLTYDGVLSFLVVGFDEDIGFVPRHSMRLVTLFAAALEERGQNPESRVAVLGSTEALPMIACLLKKSPITKEEKGRLLDFATEMGFELWAMPGVELDTMHSKFLRRTPSQRKTFLAKAPLVLDAPSDDKPFFFNFYRWSDLTKYLHEYGSPGPMLASAQIVLASMLFMAVVLSLLLILLPLLAFKRQGLETRGRWGLVAFFSGIGLGFIFIEVGFVQKFVLFLGYPTYSLSVVLFSLLVYSGIGSLLTGRMKTAPQNRLVPILAGLVALTLLYLVALPWLFRLFLGSAFAVRVIIASALLLPLGLLMGMFFPSGIEIVRRGNLNFVPWAWGINGCASVVGAILAIVLAMSHGFRLVTYVALAMYMFGVLGMLMREGRPVGLRAEPEG